ncbi:hypothetical protein PAXINDRAFT_118855 [Paxillus involutus ATCC 200175]|uniref:Protein kinase domain-containing protein n=1 Tax=Paxillus involutus ATCC 200175 TaxID=664439 RepID=A0A0C9ST07_PAXIN|nr:hypothetical protein PAXINDRAFT_118855 [Paxillus involutus ATCC 200175]
MGSGVLMVAVKVVRLNDVGEEEVTRRKSKILLREASVWARLSHKNILMLHGVTYDFSPLPSFVSLWMSNGSLEHFLGVNRGLSIRRKISILTQIADGLGYLHSQHVVHGDLTNTNVLISDDGSPCIADFGLSFMLLEQEISCTNMIGNVRWAAPELFAEWTGRAARPTEESDLYSYGWIMFRVFTGRPPYHWLTSATAVIASKIRRQDPFRWDPGTTQLPGICMDLIQSLCSFDPKARPPLRVAQQMLENFPGA